MALKFHDIFSVSSSSIATSTSSSTSINKKSQEIIGPKNLITVCALFLASLNFGYNVGELNLPQDYIQCWISSLSYNTSINCDQAPSLQAEGLLKPVILEYALISAMLPVGAIFGSFIGAEITNIFGRKNCLFVICIWISGFSILEYFCQDLNSWLVLMFGRLANGFGVGVVCSVIPLYYYEISPNTKTGLYDALFQVGFNAGNFMANIFGLHWLLGQNNIWRNMFLINILPNLGFLLCYPEIPESPSFLITKRDYVQAEMNNYLLKGPNAKIVDHQNQSHEQNLSFTEKYYQIFKIKSVRKATIIFIIITALCNSCGMNAIYYYSTSIFESAGIPQEYAGLCSLGLNFINILAVSPAMMADRFGRRMLFLVAFTVQAFCTLAMTILLTFSPNSKLCSYLSIVPMVIYIIFYQIGPGPLPWGLASEALPYKYKSGVQALVATTCQLFTFLVAILFPLLEALIGQYSFLVFTGCNVFAFVFVYFCLVETKGKSVDQVQREYDAMSFSVSSFWCRSRTASLEF